MKVEAERYSKEKMPGFKSFSHRIYKIHQC